MTTIHVKATSGSKITLEVDLSITVESLKATLAAADKANIPAPQQRLIYKGHVLKDEKTLESYGALRAHRLRLASVTTPLVFCVCLEPSSASRMRASPSSIPPPSSLLLIDVCLEHQLFFQASQIVDSTTIFLINTPLLRTKYRDYEAR